MSFELTKNEIKKLAENGGMAPSGGNVQPWRVLFTKNIMEVRLDPERSDSFIDVGKYASIFALGCFLENIIITAETLGLKYEWKYFDFKDIRNPIIILTFSKRNKAKKPHPLHVCIPKRATNRQIHDGTILSDKTIKHLAKSLSGFSFKYQLHSTSLYPVKKKIAKILGVADGIRNTNGSTLKQLIQEFRWTQNEVEKTRDGIDLKTCELPGYVEKMLNLLKKAPSITKVVPRKALEMMSEPVLIGSSHLCCLGLKEKLTYKNVFYAGCAMQRFWLEATKLGLALQPWAIVPFFIIRVNYFKGVGFSESEKKDIKKVEKDLRNEFGLTKTEINFFIFRLSRSKPSSARALRLHWENYTQINN